MENHQFRHGMPARGPDPDIVDAVGQGNPMVVLKDQDHRHPRRGIWEIEGSDLPEGGGKDLDPHLTRTVVGRREKAHGGSRSWVWIEDGFFVR